MNSIKSKNILLIFVAAILLLSISSCRTHSGGRACPSYGNIDKTKKQA